jgi:hypothetical protein
MAAAGGTCNVNENYDVRCRAFGGELALLTKLAAPHTSEQVVRTS